MMLRTIRHPNNMYAANSLNYIIVTSFISKLTHFLSGKVRLIMNVSINTLLLASNVRSPLLED